MSEKKRKKNKLIAKELSIMVCSKNLLNKIIN